MTKTAKQIPLDTLRDSISEALSTHVKSYNMPSVCVGLGLAPGESDEAHRSKKLYVKSRLLGLKEQELLRIAADTLKEFDDETLADMVSEMTLHAEHRITEITRRDVLKALNGLDSLFRDVDLFEGLNIVSSEPLFHDSDSSYRKFFQTLPEEIEQHYVRNDDLSNEELLIKCGALTCSQARFFALIEKLLNPVVRRGDEQTSLAQALNVALKADGFSAVVVGNQSGHPVYAVQRTATGVTGVPKNLIFASINTKPDLYFTDAINNDIAIRNDTDALIYDRSLTDSGLLWNTMVEWWQERECLPDIIVAKRELYKRLVLSVREARSPGEYALFHTYYNEFKVLGDQLPALIPQVFLHYDPRTMKERGCAPVLLRQRMDMLLLIERNVRIVIEVDGKQHYADGDKASTAKYADMVAEDRRLRLAGYELYRFGATEFKDATLSDGKYMIGSMAKQVAINFFQQLFEKHHIKTKF